MPEVSDRYIEREGPGRPKLPASPRQETIFRDIRNILAKYLVKGDSEDLDHVALEIWRVTRR